MKVEKVYQIETEESAIDAAWIEDRVEVYYDTFTLYFKVENKEQAKQIFNNVDVTWHYYD